MKNTCACGGRLRNTDSNHPIVARWRCDRCGDVVTQRKRVPALTTYSMMRQKGGEAYVTREQAGTYSPLRLRLDLTNHSPTGFEWGYAGSGPAQLALAILADSTNDSYALKYHQAFKFDVVSRAARDQSWLITSKDVHDWILGKER